ncbi:TlpA disulfide reductase family protein [Rhabdobacter roseus]|uniref:Thiol-disulfide isomerase/thioredoxin n=1 Tax=Rhabdobacter roseus TaxID=1655419 RepID=A0A840TVE8_9BACT|nr:TlpA disulfide reductase family protein [Rhabdobacter roseus]MBB5285243.1 thiol-disulfide isomerase/thioredoxin [Rhabdobacter roseus]
MKPLRFLSSLLLGLLLACEKPKTDIVIQGAIENLPDGQIKLVKAYDLWTELDSTLLQNGTFRFTLPASRFPEPLLVTLRYEGSDMKGLFMFDTNRRFRGYPMNMSLIMLEDGLDIKGTYTENEYKYVSCSVSDKRGKQTQVMYNDTLDFARIAKVGKIKELIRLHPYSYYYLYELQERVAQFSDEQFLSTLACFDEDVQQSTTARELREYIETRGTKKLNAQTQLPDPSEQLQPVLAQGAGLHMVILWASWCGPCRAEIPELRKIYERYGADKRFGMVSVSVDDDKNRWQEAMQQEKMPWRQLLVNKENARYDREIFSYDRSIPTTLIVDAQGKILKKVVGYDENSLEEFSTVISEYLAGR